MDMNQEEKIASMISHFSRPRLSPGMQQNNSTELGYTEARAYLELNSWDLNKAIKNVNQDFVWSMQHHSSSS